MKTGKTASYAFMAYMVHLSFVTKDKIEISNFYLKSVLENGLKFNAC